MYALDLCGLHPPVDALTCICALQFERREEGGAGGCCRVALSRSQHESCRKVIRQSIRLYALLGRHIFPSGLRKCVTLSPESKDVSETNSPLHHCYKQEMPPVWGWAGNKCHGCTRMGHRRRQLPLSWFSRMPAGTVISKQVSRFDIFLQ